MRTLFKTSHEYLNYKLVQNSRFLTRVSYLHNLTKNHDSDSKLGFLINELEELESSKPENRNFQSSSETEKLSGSGGNIKKMESSVQISHQWPEWMDLMECLLKGGYFDGDGNPFSNGNGELGSKEAHCIRTACLNFARDRYTLIRYFSRKDIQVIAGCGCPSLDRKVVNSGKRLRAHVGLDEGNVCSSCYLRGNCERAYVKAREDEGGRTVDVMRILLTYGLDSITRSVENKPCYKLVKESVRRLLKEMVHYSTNEPRSDLPNPEPANQEAPLKDHLSPQGKCHINFPIKQGDWHCPKCNFLNFARNIRCLRCDGLFEDRLKRIREEREDLPLKKGDWICSKCNFMNFAKNTRCLLCKEKPPPRQLNPGEWECESCNYINFRRNMVCLKCDHRRLKTSNPSKPSAQSEPRNGGYLNVRSGMKYIANDNRDRRSQYKGAGQWRFVEEVCDNDKQSNSTNDDVSGFFDFPIAGGKSDLSHNPQKREEWKLKKSKPEEKDEDEDDDDDDFRSTTSNRKLDLLESTDDEEISGWFGRK